MCLSPHARRSGFCRGCRNDAAEDYAGTYQVLTKVLSVSDELSSSKNSSQRCVALFLLRCGVAHLHAHFKSAGACDEQWHCSASRLMATRKECQVCRLSSLRQMSSGRVRDSTRDSDGQSSGACGDERDPARQPETQLPWRAIHLS